MKKILKKLILSVCIAAGLAAGLLACHQNENSTETAEEDPVSYYGCPNSWRIRKLNLKKKKIK